MLFIAIAAGILLIAILGYAAIKPKNFNVQRATLMQTQPDEVFPLVNDFRNWARWSPYEKLDREMKKTYHGPASGTGAVYEWKGNRQAGEGRMEITETSPPSRIAIKLDFVKPFEGHNLAEFLMKPEGDSTKVVWRMHGPQPYFFRLMTIFFSMDKLIGRDFEAGLANIKSLVERSADETQMNGVRRKA